MLVSWRLVGRAGGRAGFFSGKNISGERHCQYLSHTSVLQSLSDETLQTIAAEMNLSGTAFIELQSDDSSFEKSKMKTLLLFPIYCFSRCFFFFMLFMYPCRYNCGFFRVLSYSLSYYCV